MEGIINISGVIGEQVNLIDVISQVKKQKDATSFTVYIDSQGGLVDTGFDIYNYLISLGLPIKTVGRGVVASIATVIYLAGSRREITSGTTFMIHYPMISSLESATSEELDYYSKELKKIEARVKKFYSEKTGMEEITIATMLKNETYMTEEQLFDLGFTTSKEPLQIAAILTLNQKDKKMAKNEKELGKSILSLIGDFFKEGKIDVVAKELFDAEQNVVNFPDLEEDAQVTVGAKATINGDPAQGSVVMADGRTFVFEAGELIEIVEVVEDTNEELEALKAKVEELEAEKTTRNEEMKTLKTEKKKAIAVINQIKGIQSKIVSEEGKTPEKETKKSARPLSAAIANLSKK